MTVEVHLADDNDSDFDWQACEFLRRCSGAEPLRSINDPIAGDERKGDPIAIAALILAVPGAILATVGFAERARLMERIRRFLEKAKKSRAHVTMRTSDKRQLDLSHTTADEVMDLPERSSRD